LLVVALLAGCASLASRADAWSPPGSPPNATDDPIGYAHWYAQYEVNAAEFMGDWTVGLARQQTCWYFPAYDPGTPCWEATSAQFQYEFYVDYKTVDYAQTCLWNRDTLGCSLLAPVVAEAYWAQNTTLGLGRQAVQDATCVESQVGTPDPTRGSGICQAAGTAVKDVGQAKSDALALVAQAEQIAGAAVAQAQQDAICIEGQVNSPNPSNGDAVCQAAGSGIKNANDRVNDAKSTVNGSPGDWSDSCTSQSGTVADGYLGDTYVKLRVQQAGDGTPNATWICYRGSNAQAGDFGGRVDVTGAGASSTAPSVDSTNYKDCSTTSGNSAPPPHPLLAGTLVGQPFLIDTYSTAGAAWLCVQAGNAGERVVVSTPGTTPPTIKSYVDSPKPSLPPPSAGRTGYASSTCQTSGGSNAKRLVNVEGASGVHAWAYKWDATPTKTDVCVRVEAAGSGSGGMVELDTTNSPGISPVLTTSSTDMTPCDAFPVFSLTSPVTAGLSMSDPGSNPASVCLVTPTGQERLTLGTSGQATRPDVRWTPDPDTP
jgi:hypothetical protein